MTAADEPLTPQEPQVVTAITSALASRLPMREVERVHAELPGAPVPHDRGGSILRVLESGDIAVSDVGQVLPTDAP